MSSETEAQASAAPPNAAGADPPTDPGTDDAAPAESTSKANEEAAKAQLPPATEANGDDTKGEDAPETAETTTADPSGATVVAPDSTPASAKKNKDHKKRRSSTGIPEHKAKKANQKKKGPELQLDADAGDLFLANMKGWPKWPAIICDDEMLPEQLLGNRPVTARRPDGTYREDFLEGGKNVRDRTYPVMFLGTYEFSWMVNTSLSPFTAEEAANTKTEKLTKTLQAAYAEAKESHDLDHYKLRLVEFQQAAEEAEAAAAAKKAKTPKKKSKKSEDTVEDEDEDMLDAEDAPPKSAKSSSKKRKAEEDGVDASGKKKMKLNLNKGAKTPNGESASKAKAAKAKTPKSDKKATKAAKEKEPQMSEKEKHERRKQATLYCRHKLQKAFLTNDTPPKDDDMASMAKLFDQLEKNDDMDAQILRDTKIHKVMKGIGKLENIPKDKEHQFKKRSQTLLETWSKLLGESTTDKARPSTAGGEKKEEGEGQAAAKAEEKKESEEKNEEKTEPVEPTGLGDDAKDEATDTVMLDAAETKADQPTEAEDAKENGAIVDTVETKEGEVAA